MKKLNNIYLLKDDDIVCDFFGCNETIDILRACHLRKGIVYMNADVEENILKPYTTINSEEFKFKFVDLLKEQKELDKKKMKNPKKILNFTAILMVLDL